MPVVVTQVRQHAIERYRERITPCSWAEAGAALLALAAQAEPLPVPGQYRAPDGTVLVINAGVLITVWPNAEALSAPAGGRRVSPQPEPALR